MVLRLSEWMLFAKYTISAQGNSMVDEVRPQRLPTSRKLKKSGYMGHCGKVRSTKQGVVFYHATIVSMCHESEAGTRSWTRIGE
jgi:hypothetical protein